MDVYTSDEERGEALKKWWKDNGGSVVTGVMIGLVLVFGGRWWWDKQSTAAELASTTYAAMFSEMSRGENESASAKGEQLMAQHQKSPYAVLAALALAKIKAEQDNLVGAESHLQWALDHTKRVEMQQLIRLRLARVKLSLSQADQALGLLEGHSSTGYEALFQEILGDILVHQGKLDEARSAYQAALEVLDEDAANRSMLKMKLDDLAVADVTEKVT